MPSISWRQTWRLLCRHGLGVREEQHVAQLDYAGAIVLGQRVLVELGERRSQSLLHLRGERLAAILPINGKKLRQFIGALDHARQRLRHQTAMRRVTRHLANEQQWSMTQLHLLARLNGERGNLRGFDARNQRSDAIGNGHAILVELVLPQHVGQHGAPQLRFRADLRSGRALMRPQGRARESKVAKLQNILAGHIAAPFQAAGLCQLRLPVGIL